MQSPKESFHTAVKHTNEILKNFEINDIWLKRKNIHSETFLQLQLRTPEILENELVDYVLYTGNDKILTKKNISSEILRRPNQIILNARDFDFDNISNILLEDLPTYDAILNNEINKPAL